MTGQAQLVRTNLSTLSWSEDGSRFTKRYDLDANRDKLGPRATILDHHYPGARPWARHFAYELRVNQLITRHRPPVRTPRLLAHDRRRLSLGFEAVPGRRLGPKFPLELAEPDLHQLIGLAKALRSYPHRPRWLRRLPIRRRLWRAHQRGLLSATEYRALQDVATGLAVRWVFAHADINPSNIVTGEKGASLVDWEWAGLYPDGYDLAFLWFVLIDLPEARVVVESQVDTDPVAFWLSALIIELLHLEWFGGQFRPRHESNRDLLVDRLLSPPRSRTWSGGQ